jgi:outer membrane protein insertion porin family/translocation and assembly module TamA
VTRGAPAVTTVLLLALAVLWPWATPLRAQTDRPELVGLSFDGNRAFPDDSLRRAIVNRETDCRVPSVFCALGLNLKRRSYIQPRELLRDALRLQVYYFERGYREARVDTAVAAAGEGVRLSFDIEEGRPVRVDSVEVFSFDEIADSSLIRDLPLRKGDPLSVILLEATRDTLQSRFRNNGYAYADVLVNYDVPRGQYTAQVLFDLATGPHARFGTVTVDGTQALDTVSVRRMLPFGTGQTYRANQVLEGQRNLFGLELIQSARVEPLLTPGDTVIPVRVTVSEGQVHRVRGGFGWSTEECLTAEARWASRNFMGGARRLTARVRLSNILAESLSETACKLVGEGDFARLNGQVALELFQPFLGSARNSVSASAFVERQSVPNTFIRRAVGLDLAFSRDLGRRLIMTVGFRPALTDLDAADLFFCSSFAACLPQDIEIFDGANWLSPLALNFTQDRRNSVLNPSSGWAWLVDAEHARSYTASDFEYNRILGEATAYRNANGWVLAGRLAGGMVGRGRFADIQEGRLRVVHPQKRFYSGGANSVRGFAENRLGPRVLAADLVDLLGYPTEDAAGPVCLPEEVAAGTCDAGGLEDGDFLSQPVGGTVQLEANAEVRFPLLASSLQGVGFVDIGQVWLDRSEFGLGSLEVTPGFGVRYLSPIGPIRLDFALRPGGEELLPVATQGLRPWEEGVDPEGSRISVPWAGGATQILDWVETDEVAFLSDPVLYGGGSGFFRRFQLHISIGQAF